jgi:phosphoglycolate phosphatase
MRVEALVLWDVDKTLVDVSGVSRDIYSVAFEQVTGRPLDKLAEMAGRTEQAILVDTLMRKVGRALPGAHEAIAALRRDGVVQSVATGNLRSITETKLQAFGLIAGLDFDVGGYGSDDGVRAELARLARARTCTKIRRRPADGPCGGDRGHAARRSTLARQRHRHRASNQLMAPLRSLLCTP